MKKISAVIICPGRGTYNKTDLGYLHQYHENKIDFINSIDRYRAKSNGLSIWEIDGRSDFSFREHIPGENSAALIYACSYADFLDINRESIDVVAVTGNSMGWYTALVCAGALNVDNGTHLINTMGSLMKEQIIGGQLIYPEVDESWVHSPGLTTLINKKIIEVNMLPGHCAYTSIYFGGYRIIGGTNPALSALMNELPPREGRYPFKLLGNAAFHTPLMIETAARAREQLPASLFCSPRIPLVDGRGKVWMPHSSNLQELWDYTLGEQVNETYDFSTSVEVAVKEFAPDYLIITGPGMTHGGAVAQVLINRKLKPIKNKEDFKILQDDTPYLLSMADPSQRRKVL